MDYSPQNVTFPVKMDFNPFLPVIPAFYGMYSISIASYGITSAAIGDGAQKRENESGPKGERPSTREHLDELVTMRVHPWFPRGWWRKRLLQLPLQRQRLRRLPSRCHHRRSGQGAWGRSRRSPEAAVRAARARVSAWDRSRGLDRNQVPPASRCAPDLRRLHIPAR